MCRYRNDAIEVPAELTHLRFWRHTDLEGPGVDKKQGPVPSAHRADDVPKPRLRGHNQHSAGRGGGGGIGYLTSPGLLGYEWDTISDSAYRPPGLISLTRTRMDIDGQLMQAYGGGYKGSGLARHSVTLYRDQRSGALVFSTGTCQWAWALATAPHDYSWDIAHVPVDRNLAQATLNMLADMDVPPSDVPDPTMTTSVASVDRGKPHSRINWPAHAARPVLALHSGHTSHRHMNARIRGTASDEGGHVAAVEVSIDAGNTWFPAHGLSHWTFPLLLHFPPAINATSTTATTTNTTTTTTSTTSTCTTPSEQENVYDMLAPAGRWGESEADCGARRIYPSYPDPQSLTNMATDNDVYITHHDGIARYNLDVCGEKGQGQHVVNVMSRATDDSGWLEQQPAMGSQEHSKEQAEFVVVCPTQEQDDEAVAEVLRRAGHTTGAAG